MDRASVLHWVRDRDAELAEWMQLHCRPGSARAKTASLVAHSADGWWSLLTVLALWLSGGARPRAVAAAMLVGFLATALVVRVIKVSVRRQRPAGDWGARQRRLDPHAFPSGHSARAAMLAVVVGATLGSPWVGVGLGLWALVVATARVAVGVHYLSDVCVGAFIGSVCGLVTTLLLAPIR